MKQLSTFPVDVWVRRVMQTLYVDSKTSDKDIRNFAENKFGNLSGYAQQYLFYYARENNIGK
jgi:N-glycosylase/DNA lyase